jgi:hypothetical protein
VIEKALEKVTRARGAGGAFSKFQENLSRPSGASEDGDERRVLA